LTYLHAQGMVHRDVKPDNIFLTEAEGVKLMDLGIAKGGEIAPMTQTGVVLGTPHYMAPEQLKGESTASSDQYALGVTAYEMLAGQRPFRGATSADLLHQHITESVPRLSQFRPEASALLEDVLETMLAKQPSQRFSDVASAVDSLCAALQAGDDEGLDTEAFSGPPNDG
jgi:serine/threonine-protein kinase